MNLSIQRRMAAEIMKCGESRVWMSPEAGEKIRHAITRNDVRGLIKDGLVRKIPEKKSLHQGPRARRMQESKGRRSGHGSRKGAAGARTGKKEKWLKTVRPQRKFISDLRKEGRLEKNYGVLYSQIKGNMFRSKHHLISHMREHKLANISVSEYEAAEKARKTEMKKQAKEALKKKYEKIRLAVKSGAEISGKENKSGKKQETVKAEKQDQRK